MDHAFLEQVVQKELGFSSIDAFAKRQAAIIFQQKTTDSEQIISGFETKYGMKLAEFQVRVVNQKDLALKRFGMIEKEDDLMDWEFEEHGLAYFRERLAQFGE